MTGKILGFEISTGTGTISGDDGKRYKFSKDNWKESTPPTKEIKVDFDVTSDGVANDIYQVRDTVVENNETMMGLIAVGITFFFGFIGTFVARLVLAKQPVGATIIPTAIHFVITLLVLIPILGWILYMVGTIYYMVKNYTLVSKPAKVSANKYAS
jgi:hypothetical protein